MNGYVSVLTNKRHVLQRNSLLSKWCMMYYVCMYDVWCMMYDVWCIMYVCMIYQIVHFPVWQLPTVSVCEGVMKGYVSVLTNNRHVLQGNILLRKGVYQKLTAKFLWSSSGIDWTSCHLLMCDACMYVCVMYVCVYVWCMYVWYMYVCMCYVCMCVCMCVWCTYVWCMMYDVWYRIYDVWCMIYDVLYACMVCIYSKNKYQSYIWQYISLSFTHTHTHTHTYTHTHTHTHTHHIHTYTPKWR